MEILRATETPQQAGAYYIRRARIHMPKKGLDIFDVNTALKQVTCEAVAAGMR